MARPQVAWDPSWLDADSWALHPDRVGAGGEPGPLERAVEALTDQQRVVIECVVFEKASFAEAGRRLGMTKQGAHALWKRTRVQLMASVVSL